MATARGQSSTKPPSTNRIDQHNIPRSLCSISACCGAVVDCQTRSRNPGNSLPVLRACPVLGRIRRNDDPSLNRQCWMTGQQSFNLAQSLTETRAARMRKDDQAPLLLSTILLGFLAHGPGCGFDCLPKPQTSHTGTEPDRSDQPQQQFVSMESDHFQVFSESFEVITLAMETSLPRSNLVHAGHHPQKSILYFANCVNVLGNLSSWARNPRAG